MVSAYLAPKIVKLVRRAVHACNATVDIIYRHWMIKRASIAQSSTAKVVTRNGIALSARQAFQVPNAWMSTIVDTNVQSATYRLALLVKLTIF